MAELPTAEWLADLAALGPYRVSCHALSHPRAPWGVVDIRPEDEPTVAGPFATRVEAIGAADRLNAGTLPNGSDIMGLISKDTLTSSPLGARTVR